MMKSNTAHRTISRRFLRYAPWVALYLFVIGSSTTFAAKMYEKYDTRELPSGYIELSVDKTAYQQGEQVTFTVTNHFPVPVFVMNQCPEEPLNVYRWENDAWVALHATAKDDGECYNQERNVGVPSEDSRSYNFNDWPDLFATSGVYRIAASIDHYPDVPFQDFVVLAPPEVVEVVDPPEIRYVKEAPKPVTPVVLPLPEPVVLPPVEEEPIKLNDDDRRESEREYDEGDDD